MKALHGMAKTCRSDIFEYCSKVPPGGRRIYDCLTSHRATLTDDCRKGLPQFETRLRDQRCSRVWDVLRYPVCKRVRPEGIELSTSLTNRRDANLNSFHRVTI
jgi:Cysteine rich repeat